MDVSQNTSDQEYDDGGGNNHLTRVSPIYKYYNIIDHDDKHLQCKICKKQLSVSIELSYFHITFKNNCVSAFRLSQAV